MANFFIAYAITMHNEGGYADNRNDPGGETWKGIARNRHPGWPGWAIVDEIKNTLLPGSSLNEALFANHPLEAMVLAFYEENFWNNLQLGAIDCQQIANQLFDASVNNGPEIAAKFLQKSINTFTNNSLVVDGAVGPKTISAVNTLPDAEVYAQISALRAGYYYAIAKENPSQNEFLHGWLSRILPFANVNASGPRTAGQQSLPSTA